jgi:protoporphyrinogen oxidase
MIVILGAGLAGLSAGYRLSSAHKQAVLIEKDSSVGGLAKTINYRGFRFDLGGHRFLTSDEHLETLLKGILNQQFVVVPRKSQIYLRDRCFDYPLRPSNAIFGLGCRSTVKIISDYFKERIRQTFFPKDTVSLEDWVVQQFGRTMFDLYFKQYSEKVWGIDSKSISKEWVSQRIEGLSLLEALKRAVFKVKGKGMNTLAEEFLYPPLGIGQISEALRDCIQRENDILTDTRIVKIEQEDFYVRKVVVRQGEDILDIDGEEFISSIPLTNLLHMLHPVPPADVLQASSRLHFRDLVTVTLLLNRERVSDLTWMYLPERHIPMGRIHEPRNWSPRMAPEGRTHIVAEYFCFRGDNRWNSSDERLASITIEHLANLNIIEREDVIDCCVVRVPKAYPLFDIEYREHYEKILCYLENFKNLFLVGRGGTFQYLNMDHAMKSGIEAAETILERPRRESKSPHREAQEELV